MGHAQGRSHMREGGWKKEVKIVNMVEVPSIQDEYKIFKPIEIIIR
jgi:hypothetical protein